MWRETGGEEEEGRGFWLDVSTVISIRVALQHSAHFRVSALFVFVFLLLLYGIVFVAAEFVKRKIASFRSLQADVTFTSCYRLQLTHSVRPSTTMRPLWRLNPQVGRL